jgi:D-amino-acid dehydrogenase
MVLHSHPLAFEAASAQAAASNLAISDAEQKIKILSPAQAQALEPALAVPASLLGAIVYPQEAYGNCALFTKQLKNVHQQRGVQYRLNTQVTGLESVGQRWRLHTQAYINGANPDSLLADDASTTGTGKSTAAEVFDAVIIAAGEGSMGLLAPLGIHFPVLNTHAYTVTVPVQERHDAPSHCVLDAATGNTITPIGQRIRVSGQHQLGKAAQPRSAAFKALGQAIQHWYPYASKVSEASYDNSASCVTIDAKPIVGATQLAGLYVNMAHGPQHWALAFGCAQALADTLHHTVDRFDLAPFSPQRFA